MIYVKHGHGKWVRKDLDPFNSVNQIRWSAKYVFEQYSHIVGLM